MSERSKDRLADALSLLVTIVVALGVGALLIWFTSSEPGVALRAFFWGPFTNNFFMGNMLQAAAPLMFTGLGMVVAFQAGAVNLGGEGQVLSLLVNAVIFFFVFTFVYAFVERNKQRRLEQSKKKSDGPTRPESDPDVPSALKGKPNPNTSRRKTRRKR